MDKWFLSSSRDPDSTILKFDRPATGMLRRHNTPLPTSVIKKPIRRSAASTYHGFPLSRHHSFPDRRHRMVVCTISALLQFICTLIMADKERTFLMIKPDGVQRGLVGKIIQRFEQKGFKLVAMKMLWVSNMWFARDFIFICSHRVKIKNILYNNLKASLKILRCDYIAI